MANFPTIVSDKQMLRQYKAKNSYTDAQVASLLTAFGWAWSEDHLTKLMNGRMKPSEEQKVFIRLFLLDKFYDYNRS